MKTSIVIIVICGLLFASPSFGKDKKHESKAVKRFQRELNRPSTLTKSQRNEAAAECVTRVSDAFEEAKRKVKDK